jgi:hypothetical protein
VRFGRCHIGTLGVRPRDHYEEMPTERDEKPEGSEERDAKAEAFTSREIPWPAGRKLGSPYEAPAGGAALGISLRAQSQGLGGSWWTSHKRLC